MRRCIAILLSLSLLLALVPAAAAHEAPFADVSEGDYFYESVLWAAAEGVTSGMEPGRFAPARPCTRAQVVTFLWRAVGCPEPGSTRCPFTDVVRGRYDEKAILWAVECGITNGVDATHFRPGGTVTRGQFVTFLYRAAGAPAVAGANPFSDVAASQFYANAVRWAYGEAITSGISATRFAPESKCTRAQVVTFLYRARGCLRADGLGIRPLHVEGTKLVNDQGQTVQLRGISTHGLAWFPQYVNPACFAELRAWGANVVRLAMYTDEYGGYCSGGDPAALKALIDEGVRDAVAAGLYVIIDWHVLSDRDPTKYQPQAIAFFSEMAKKYASCPNVIYEICNEPNGGTSWKTIKAYAAAVLPAIRRYAPDAVVIVGTPTWSQDVDLASADPIRDGGNLLYAFHFYAGTHRAAYRQKVQAALDRGLPVFVSEFGVCDASGNGGLDLTSADEWMKFLNQNSIGYAMWSLCNKAETASAIRSACAKTSGFTMDDLTDAGRWLRTQLGGTEDVAIPTPPTPSGTLSATLTPTNRWQSEGRCFTQFALTLTNGGPACTDWSLELPMSAECIVSQAWNCTAAVSGTTLRLTPAAYNASLPSGATLTDIGLILESPAPDLHQLTR